MNRCCWRNGYFAETAFAQDHEEVEIGGADDILAAHVVRNLAIEFRRLFGFGRTDDGRLLADLFAEDFRVDAVCDGHVVKLALLFRQQFEPALHRRFDDLRYAERQRAHEIVARRPIPIPHLDQQPPILVFRFQIAMGMLPYIKRQPSFTIHISFDRGKEPQTNKRRCTRDGRVTYNVSVSFHSGFSDALMVFVFFLTLSVSGMSRALT